MILQEKTVNKTLFLEDKSSRVFLWNSKPPYDDS